MSRIAIVGCEANRFDLLNEVGAKRIIRNHLLPEDTVISGACPKGGIVFWSNCLAKAAISYLREYQNMKTLEQKIEIMQALMDRKPIQAHITELGRTHLSHLKLIEGWHDTLFPNFNWAHYDYRVKSESIEDLAKEHGVDEDTLRCIAADAKNDRRLGKEGRDYYINNKLFKVTIESDGTTTVGCKTFTWEEIDAFGKRKGWWV